MPRVPEAPAIVDMLHELSSVQQELKAANRDLVDALSRSESADRIADFEQRVALLNGLAESIAEKIAILAEAQFQESRR